MSLKKINPTKTKAWKLLEAHFNEIKSAEILGAITASKTEKEFKDYFYSEYGQDAFAEGEMDVLVKYYLDKETEDAEGEKEEEKDAGKEEEGGDDDLDLDI